MAVIEEENPAQPDDTATKAAEANREQQQFNPPLPNTNGWYDISSLREEKDYLS
jgi:hypothetical protein